VSSGKSWDSQIINVVISEGQRQIL